jgi:hypothetical protein
LSVKHRQPVIFPAGNAAISVSVSPAQLLSKCFKSKATFFAVKNCRRQKPVWPKSPASCLFPAHVFSFIMLFRPYESKSHYFIFISNGVLARIFHKHG